MALTEPRWLYTAAQSRAVDRCAIEEHGLPGPLLMARAARAALQALQQRWPGARRLAVFCGPGNNGGDGLLLAVLAAGRGMAVEVFLVDGEPRSEDAVEAAARARSAGLELQAFSGSVPGDVDVIVDGMLGTGISGPPRPAYAAAISAINASAHPVLALDVPSGLDADSGAGSEAAVHAALTVSFITPKRGLFTGGGPACCGAVLTDDLEVPTAAYAAAGDAVAVLDLDTERRSLAPLAVDAHKGRQGCCLLVGGDSGMGGAVLLAAEAALRCGVGLLRVATRAEHVAPLLARTPEAMPAAVRGYPELQPLLEAADAVVLGPGLGSGPWGEQMLHAVAASGLPMVLDADALNLLARDTRWRAPPRALLTPHPGEAARLLDSTARSVQADRFAAAQSLLEHGAEAVILKGNGSLVASADGIALCRAGNPGMASGGMGDVLSGIAGALLTQGLAPARAARLACVLHAEAADAAAAAIGQRGLMASDLAPRLGALLP